MALNGKQLAGGTLTNATATYYTVPASVKTRIDAFSIVNYSATAATFSLWLVPSGGSAGNTNILIQARSVAPGNSARVPEALGQWLLGGATIQMSASANTAITITASGIEQTTN